MFRFEQKHRQVSVRGEGGHQVVEIAPSWNLWKLTLAGGAVLYAIRELYPLAKFYLLSGRFGSIAGVMPIAELFSIALAIAIAKEVSFEALSNEEIRINPESGRLIITTQLWKIKQIRSFPIDEIRNLHSLESSWFNQRKNTGVELYHGKYGYRFAQGASREDRAKIVRLLESVGASTLDSSIDSTAYSPSTPPR